MSWQKIIEVHQFKYGRSFMREEQQERQFIIDAIIQEFPILNRTNVEKAFDHCCELLEAPRRSAKFLNLIADKLEASES